MFQRGINHKPGRPVLCHRAVSATSTSTANRNQIFRMKEVILLPGVAENEVARGPRKSNLRADSEKWAGNKKML